LTGQQQGKAPLAPAMQKGEDAKELMTHTFALRLFSAILLGSLVGLERQ
jgi:hypothetical protein